VERLRRVSITGVAINLLLQFSIGSPQRRVAVNLFPELCVAVDFVRRRDRVGETLYTYFYGNSRVKVPKSFTE
jgi:hypothetical protein